MTQIREIAQEDRIKKINNNEKNSIMNSMNQNKSQMSITNNINQDKLQMMRNTLAKNKRKKKFFFLELKVNQDEVIYANIKEIDRKMTFILIKARS